MGYRLNRRDEPVFMAVPKPMLTEFGINHRLESCALLYAFYGSLKTWGGYITASNFAKSFELSTFVKATHFTQLSGENR